MRSVGLWSAAEHGRSSNERGCTGVDRLPGRYWVDSAVDFNHGVEPQSVDAICDFLDLRKLAGNELLAAETRIDAHDQN